MLSVYTLGDDGMLLVMQLSAIQDQVDHINFKRKEKNSGFFLN